MKTLYISYFGALKPLVQTQVIPYLRQLAADGMDVTLVTFEEALPDPMEEARRRSEIATMLANAHIAWHPLRYHKTPSLLATLFDVAVGVLVCGFLVRRHDIDVVHARSHVPGAMALAIKRLFGTRILFDMRGMMAEEYVDAGLWKEGGVAFRLTKTAERQLFKSSDAIVMLTHRIRSLLLEREPALRRDNLHIEIIPCCADLARFTAADGLAVRQRHQLIDKHVLVYAGSTGSWYLMDDMIAFARAASRRDPRFHFLVLTHTSAVQIEALMAKGGLGADQFTILRVEPGEMPEHLAAADAAISFIKPCPSKVASSPTKIGEYLAAGLPIVSNSGIGDLDELITTAKVGTLVHRFDVAAYEDALIAMEALHGEGLALAARCRATAQRQFDLNTTGRAGYERVYEHLKRES